MLHPAARRAGLSAGGARRWPPSAGGAWRWPPSARRLAPLNAAPGGTRRW